MREQRVTRIERGWPGHFIMGDRCRYRRNTLLERGERRIVVSTVGNLWESPDANEPTAIGFERYYEVMAFEAVKDGPYWEADVIRDVGFDSPWALSECEHETDLKADAMHERVVEEIAARMEEDDGETARRTMPPEWFIRPSRMEARDE